jgi:hypothetical protein
VQALTPEGPEWQLSTQYPTFDALTNANPPWRFQLYSQGSVNSILAATQGARNSIGGNAAVNANFSGVTDAWTSKAFTDQNGKTLVGQATSLLGAKDRGKPWSRSADFPHGFLHH